MISFINREKDVLFSSNELMLLVGKHFPEVLIAFSQEHAGLRAYNEQNEDVTERIQRFACELASRCGVTLSTQACDNSPEGAASADR